MSETDLRLQVRKDSAAGRTLHFELEVRGVAEHFEPVHLALEPQAYFVRFFQKLNASAKQGDQRRIDAKSLDLTRDVCPEGFVERLWELRAQGHESLLIQSGEEWIPWEFLRLRRLDGTTWHNGLYFCEAFALTRWRHGEMPRALQLTLHRIGRVLVATGDLKAGEDEASTLGRLWEDAGRKVKTIPSEVASVLEHLEGGRLDGLHVIGHAYFDDRDPNDSSITFENHETWTPELLSPIEGKLHNRHPLVFLNTCHSSRGGQSLAHLGGWASKFMNAGVGAFVGASWATEDVAARFFAINFYTHLFAGLTLGEAARRARLKVRDRFPGDPTWLAYTVYAHPSTVVRLEANLASSVIRVEGQGSRFGTAFSIHQEKDRSLVLTCLRVVDQLGGVEALRIDGHTVRLVAGSQDAANDLAVLEVFGEIQAHPLRLDPRGRSGAAFEMAGWSWLHNHQLHTRVVHGKLAGPAGENWILRFADRQRLEEGYSGSPVINTETESVIAVFSAERDGAGQAVSVASIEAIWPGMPVGLLGFEDSATTKTSAPKRVKTRRRSMDPSEVPKRLIERVATNKVVPVIGAGLSMSAAVEDGGSLMPSYADLLHQLLEKARDIGAGEPDLGLARAALEQGDNSQAVDRIREILGLSLDRELRSILNPIERRLLPSPAHKLLRVLDFPQLLTTNYDRLLEIFVAPEHEVVTPSDAFFGNFLSEADEGKFIFKIHGDITRPETISFGRLKEQYESEQTRLGGFLGALAQQKTLLFLGFSFEHTSEDYVSLLSKHLDGCPTSHYALVPHGASNQTFRKKLREKANIYFLEYYPDDQHSQVWEFLSFLNVGKKEEPRRGRRWARWYSPDERSSYLERQLKLEESAASARYITPGLTNALATDKFLDERILPKFFRPGVAKSMRQRRDHLEQRLKDGTIEVRCLFLKSELDTELGSGDRVDQDRYAHVLDLVRNDQIDLEIRIIPDLDASELKRQEATYALILGEEPKPEVDVALAYASQATTEFFDLHMIEINTETVEQRVFKFERFWAAAWSENRTVRYIDDLLPRTPQRKENS